ncbi:MAG: hypothetical protein AB7O04_04280 [Hyphomonadaceae bacterium]
MFVLLVAFTLFNIAAAAACVTHGVRLFRKEARAAWASKRLLFIAAFLSWTFPLAAAAAVWAGWTHHAAGRADAAVIILLPIGWLILLGLVFAIVDFAEDGRLDFGRGP